MTIAVENSRPSSQLPPVRGAVDQGTLRRLLAAGLGRFAGRRTVGWDARATPVLREAAVADSFMTPLRSMDEIPDLPGRASRQAGKRLEALVNNRIRQSDQSAANCPR
jgi:hypothetical protein